MDIPLKKMDYQFHDRPLLIGGKAMEYYGLRKAGNESSAFLAGVSDHNIINVAGLHI